MLFPPPRLFFSPGARPGPCQGLRPWTPLGALPPSQFAKVVARRRQGGILQLPCSLGFRLAFSATGGARLPQFAKVVARRRQGGILQLPCSLGFRLAFSATGGARLRRPPRRTPAPPSTPSASAPPSVLRWLLMGSRKVRALRWGRLFSVADRLRPNQKDGLSSYL